VRPAALNDPVSIKRTREVTSQNITKPTMSSAETTFRNSLNSIGWSRRTTDPDATTAKPSFLQRINPFSGQSGYIRLPTSTQDLPAQLPAQSAQQESGAWFALSRWDRLIIFGCCILGAAACFVMAFVLMPVLVLKPRKFVVLWTVGSILFLCRYPFVFRFTDFVVLLLFKALCLISNI
jgi:hypothetical protein